VKTDCRTGVEAPGIDAGLNVRQAEVRGLREKCSPLRVALLGGIVVLTRYGDTVGPKKVAGLDLKDGFEDGGLGRRYIAPERYRAIHS